MFASEVKALKEIGAREAQNVSEAEEFVEFIREAKPSVYLEIGARHGWTFHLVSKVMQPGSTMIAVDLPEVFPWGDQGSAKVLEEVRQGICRSGINAIVIHANSQLESTADIVRSHVSSVDFLFIDADHKYDGVKKDWELYSPFVKKGYIAFHDIKARPKEDPAKLIEVPRLWGELKDKYKHREIGSNPGVGILTIEG